MHKSDLEQLAKLRAEEARILLDGGFPSGATYLCGYAIEMGLKAVIAGQFVANAVPDKKLVNDIYTHDLEKLVGLAGLGSSLESEKRNKKFEANWLIVQGWSETKRYEIVDGGVARSYIDAALGEKGIYKWIASNW